MRLNMMQQSMGVAGGVTRISESQLPTLLIPLTCSHTCSIITTLSHHPSLQLKTPFPQILPTTDPLPLNRPSSLTRDCSVFKNGFVSVLSLKPDFH